MMKTLYLIVLVLLLSSCAGIRFCDENNLPKGCQKWDPATRTGAGGRL